MTPKRYLILSFIIIATGIGFYLVLHEKDTSTGRRELAVHAESPGADEVPALKQSEREKDLSINLYFAQKESPYLSAESIAIQPSDDPSVLGRRIVESLIRGPQKDHIRTIPETATLRAIYVTEDGVAYVDFKDTIQTQHPGGIQAERFTLYSIVNSLVLNVPVIEAVKLLIEGREAMTLGGHIDLRFPFKANMLMVR